MVLTAFINAFLEKRNSLIVGASMNNIDRSLPYHYRNCHKGPRRPFGGLSPRSRIICIAAFSVQQLFCRPLLTFVFFFLAVRGISKYSSFFLFHSRFLRMASTTIRTQRLSVADINECVMSFDNLACVGTVVLSDYGRQKADIFQGFHRFRDG